MLEAHGGFTEALVPLGNRIKFTGTARAPRKDTLSSTACPEVEVYCTGWKPHLERTSDGSSIHAQFEIRMTSGDQRFATLFDLEYIVYQAMLGWHTHLKTASDDWENNARVTLARPLNVEITLDDKELNRSIRGWSSRWKGEVELWFRTADITP